MYLRNFDRTFFNGKLLQESIEILKKNVEKPWQKVSFTNKPLFSTFCSVKFATRASPTHLLFGSLSLLMHPSLEQ